MGLFGKKKPEQSPSDIAATRTIDRLETLTDRLEETTAALEALVQGLAEEEQSLTLSEHEETSHES